MDDPFAAWKDRMMSQRQSSNVLDVTKEGPLMQKVRGWMAGHIDSLNPPTPEKPKASPPNDLTAIINPHLFAPDELQNIHPNEGINGLLRFNKNPAYAYDDMVITDFIDPRGDYNRNAIWDFYDEYPPQKFQKR